MTRRPIPPLFEAVALNQAGKIRNFPVLWLREENLAAGRAGPEDLAVLRRCDDPTEVVVLAIAARAAESAVAAPATAVALAPGP